MYGEPVFVTISPSSRHSGLVMRLSHESFDSLVNDSLEDPKSKYVGNNKKTERTKTSNIFLGIITKLKINADFFTH